MLNMGRFKGQSHLHYTRPQSARQPEAKRQAGTACEKRLHQTVRARTAPKGATVVFKSKLSFYISSAPGRTSRQSAR